jgi:predicted nucleotidyltransferase
VKEGWLDEKVAPRGFPPVAESLPQVVERLVHELRPYKIILFGSYAHGNPTPDSDVDLLIIMDTDLPAVERFLLVSRLLRPRVFPVDLIVKTPAEVQAAIQKNDAFLCEILKKGRLLYERK